jgi:hypothetical protein
MTTVQLLIEKGADVNAQGGRYGGALQAAVANGRDAMASFLRETTAAFPNANPRTALPQLKVVRCRPRKGVFIPPCAHFLF